MTRTFKLISLFMVVMGAVVIMTGLHSYATRSSDKDYQPARGRVADIEKRTDYSGKSIHVYWTVNFKYSVGGVEYEDFEILQDTGPVFNSNHQIGQAVEVFYNPDDPSEAKLHKEEPFTIAKLFSLTLVGLFFIGFGIAGFKLIRSS